MTKSKKITEIQELMDSALTCVQRECEKHVDELSISGEVDFMHRGQHIGFISFNVYEEMYVMPSHGDYNSPPYSGESDFVLDSASVTIYNDGGESMLELSDSVNALIEKQNGKNLNY